MSSCCLDWANPEASIHRILAQTTPAPLLLGGLRAVPAAPPSAVLVGQFSFCVNVLDQQPAGPAVGRYEALERWPEPAGFNLVSFSDPCGWMFEVVHS